MKWESEKGLPSSRSEPILMSAALSPRNLIKQTDFNVQTDTIAKQAMWAFNNVWIILNEISVWTKKRRLVRVCCKCANQRRLSKSSVDIFFVFVNKFSVNLTYSLITYIKYPPRQASMLKVVYVRYIQKTWYKFVINMLSS